MTKNTKRLIALILACLLVLPVLAGCQKEQDEVVSIRKTQINKDGELIITYTDGTKENLGVVVGKDGDDGTDGEDGNDGDDGKDGMNGASGSVAGAAATALRSSVSVICTFKTRDGENYSGGSGVIYQLDKKKGNAFIITNYHVVFEKDSKDPDGISEDIRVYLYGGELEDQQIEAAYVGGSQNYDIAVLYVEDSEILRNSDAVAVEVADSNLVFPGQTAIAVGNAEGEGISVTTGIISVDSEHITMDSPDETGEISHRVMRMDTAVNHGNSGGGLFNDQGQLIGIVNAKIVQDDVDNIGYAIPTQVAIGAADNIIDYCFETDCKTMMRPMLGITIVNIASSGIYDEETGLMRIEETTQVQEISKTSLMYDLLEEEDILVSITLRGETVKITRQHYVIDLMLRARVGDEIVLTVLRDGEEVTVTVTLPESCLTEY